MFLSRLGMDGEIIPTPGYSDDSISLILDEDTVFTGDLPGRAWGADPMRRVELSWQRMRALNVEAIYPGHGPVRKLERKCLGFQAKKLMLAPDQRPPIQVSGLENRSACGHLLSSLHFLLQGPEAHCIAVMYLERLGVVLARSKNIH